MDAIISFIQAHQTTAALAGFYVLSAFIGALPAPTAESGQFYKFFFAFANTLGANIARARSTAVEGSPNWAPAVQKHLDLTNQKPPAPQP
jgi:hypothetical protein